MTKLEVIRQTKCNFGILSLRIRQIVFRMKLVKTYKLEMEVFSMTNKKQQNKKVTDLYKR